MFIFGCTTFILGLLILINPALLGMIVGFLLLMLGAWIIFGWYKVNKVISKSFSVGKYEILFQNKKNHK